MQVPNNNAPAAEPAGLMDVENHNTVFCSMGQGLSGNRNGGRSMSAVPPFIELPGYL